MTWAAPPRALAQLLEDRSPSRPASGWSHAWRRCHRTDARHATWSLGPVPIAVTWSPRPDDVYAGGLRPGGHVLLPADLFLAWETLRRYTTRAVSIDNLGHLIAHYGRPGVRLLALDTDGEPLIDALNALSGL